MKQSLYLFFFLVPILFFNCTQKTADHKQAMQAGVSKIDITPPIGYPVHNKISKGVLDPLEVKTLVLTQGETSAALVIADLFYTSSTLSNIVRKKASEETGIPVSNICVAATHTHADPTYSQDVEDYVQKMNDNTLTPQDEKDYAGQLINNIVQSVVKAQNDLSPVSVKSGIVSVEGLSFNRRHLLKNGIVKMNGGLLNQDIIRAVGPVDPDLGVILFKDETTGDPYASLSTFAMQLATIGSTEKFSSGFPHFLEQTLQNKFGENFISVFGEGPCADVNHLDITKPGPQSGYELTTKVVGEKLATSFLGIIPELHNYVESLAVRSKKVQIPLQSYSDMDLEWAKSHDDTNASSLIKARMRKILLLEELKIKHGDTIPLEVQVFKLNEETAIVALPGQFFVELGLMLKEKSPFKNTLILTLSNSHEDCIPIRKAYTEGGYEVIYSLVESGGGEMLIETSLSLLHEMKK